MTSGAKSTSSGVSAFGGAGVAAFTGAGASAFAGVASTLGVSTGAGASAFAGVASTLGVSTGAGASASTGVGKSTSMTSGSSSTTVGAASPFISARACSTVIPKALALASADLKSKCSGISTMFYNSLERSRDTSIFSNSPKVNCHKDNNDEWEE